MNEDLERLLKSDARYRSVLKAVVDSPYIERHALEGQLSLPHDDLEAILSVLVEKMVILELSSQADSSVESRVPKKVYMANPELEGAIQDVL